MKPACLLFSGLMLPAFLNAALPLFRLDQKVDRHTLVICGKLMLVEASIDGQAGLFLLDTGASQLVLNERIFGKESTPRKGDLLDANGFSQPVREVFIQGFSWGALHREEFFAKVINLDSLERYLHCPVMGLIGFEVIQQVEIHIDYGQRQLTLFRLDEQGTALEPDPAAPDHLFSIKMERHVPVIRAGISGHRGVLRLGLDSGATLNIIDGSWENKLMRRAARRYRISFNGAWSSKRSDYVTIDTLHIDGQMGLLYCKLALSGLSHLHDNGIYVDGLLGIELFRLGRVAINYRLKRISLWVAAENVYALKYKPLLTQIPPMKDNGPPYRK